MSDSARPRRGRFLITRKKASNAARKSSAMLVSLFVVFGTVFGSGAFAVGETSPTPTESITQSVATENATVEVEETTSEESTSPAEQEPEATEPEETTEEVSEAPAEPTTTSTFEEAPVEEGTLSEIAESKVSVEAEDSADAGMLLDGVGSRFAPQAYPSPAPVANPALPQVCGLSVAVVFDLSNSLTDADIASSKQAGHAFVDSLAGTPSSVGVYSFASFAPATNNQNLGATSVSTTAGAQAVKSHISGLQRPPNSRGGTNWDRGLAQIPADYDLIVFITDGNPTAYGTPGTWGNGDYGTSTDQIDIDRASASANAHKNAETFVMGLGVGADLNTTNLTYISGTTAGKDYYLMSNYSELADTMRAIALSNCVGTVSVVKTIEGEPASGWEFSTDTDGVSPSSAVTGENGAVNFEVEFPEGADPDTEIAVTIVETEQDGYQLEPQDGFNAVCTDRVTGDSVPVSNDAELGFVVELTMFQAISCEVVNAAIPLWELPVVQKTAAGSYDVDYEWEISKNADQTEFQLPDEAGNDTANVRYTVEVTEGAEKKSNGVVQGSITVTNPNTESMVVTLKDSLSSGEVCTITGDDVDADAAGLQVELDPDENTFDYRCEIADDTVQDLEQSTTGRNTVTVRWDNDTYPTQYEHVTNPDAGTTSVEATADYTFTEAKVTNREVNVTDQFNGEDVNQLNEDGVLTWGEEGKAHTFTYTKEFDGVPGECTIYDNTATVIATDGDGTPIAEDSEEVEVCTTIAAAWDKVDAEDPETLLAGSAWTLTQLTDKNGDPITNDDREPLTWIIEDCTEEPCEGIDLDPAAGKFLVEGLTLGEYELVETAAPPGYHGIQEPIKFTITADNAQAIFEIDPVENTRMLGDIAWEKVEDFTDEDGNRLHLGGTTWKLVDPDGTEIIVEDCIADTADGCVDATDKDHRAGYFLLTELPWGTYTLTEISAPDGYVLWEGEHTFIIDADSVTNENPEIPVFENQRIPGEVTWEKIHEASGSWLAGSEWKLIFPDGTETTITDCVLEDDTTECEGLDQDGRAGYFQLVDLPWGDYTLIETKAPAGYVLPDPGDENNHYHFTVGPTNLAVEIGPIDNEQREVPSLPLTGGLGAQMFLIGGGVLALLGIGYETLRHRRRNPVTA